MNMGQYDDVSRRLDVKLHYPVVSPAPLSGDGNRLFRRASGRYPYESGWKIGSRIGSMACLTGVPANDLYSLGWLTTVCAMRSDTFGIPRDGIVLVFRLGDENASGWAGPICAGAQFSLKLFQKRCSPLLVRMCPRSSVDPAVRAPRFEATRSMRSGECGCRLTNPHISPLVARICLTPLIEFALNAEYPGLISLTIHVHGSFLRRASPSSSCFPSPCAWLSHARTTTKAPSSDSSVSGRRG